MDPSRLIIAGQSDGADTVAALLYDRAYAATLASMGVRPRAVALLSGAEFTRQEDVYSAASKDGPAALVVQSLTDGCNFPADSSLLYNLIDEPEVVPRPERRHPPRTLCRPEPGGAGGGARDGGLLRSRDRIGDTSSASPLRAKATSRGVSTITRVATVPLYPPPPYEPDPCAPPPGAPTD